MLRIGVLPELDQAFAYRSVLNQVRCTISAQYLRDEVGGVGRRCYLTGERELVGEEVRDQHQDSGKVQVCRRGQLASRRSLMSDPPRPRPLGCLKKPRVVSTGILICSTLGRVGVVSISPLRGVGLDDQMRRRRVESKFPPLHLN